MITKFQLDVLEHTSRNGTYVTDEEAVFEMADQGFLNDHGGTGFWSEGTRGFTLSRKGREALNEHYGNLCRFPEPKPKRLPSPAFEAWRRYCDAFSRIPFSDFWKEVWPSLKYQ